MLCYLPTVCFQEADHLYSGWHVELLWVDGIGRAFRQPCQFDAVIACLPIQALVVGAPLNDPPRKQRCMETLI